MSLQNIIVVFFLYLLKLIYHKAPEYMKSNLHLCDFYGVFMLFLTFLDCKYFWNLCQYTQECAVFVYSSSMRSELVLPGKVICVFMRGYSSDMETSQIQQLHRLSFLLLNCWFVGTLSRITSWLHNQDTSHRVEWSDPVLAHLSVHHWVYHYKIRSFKIKRQSVLSVGSRALIYRTHRNTAVRDFFLHVLVAALKGHGLDYLQWFRPADLTCQDCLMHVNYLHKTCSQYSLLVACILNDIQWKFFTLWDLLFGE